MQKKLIKISLIIFIVLVFVLKVNVKATSESNLEDLIVGDRTTETANDPVVRTDDETEESEYEEEDFSNEDLEDSIGSTAEDSNVETETTTSSSSTGTSSYTPPATVQPTQSYSTIATIPEANLSLNNILNVILIAVGVILILLAIAILIRLR
ncbi:MAG: hypothetical protein IJ629_05425 [Clostridia bacterium]|nr:hypothetical protein [Clostridia bacterium]